MAAAQGYIPVSNQYQVPDGLTKTSTPQGGTAYLDASGKYGVAGSTYLPGVNGYTLAPNTLAGNVPVNNTAPLMGSSGAAPQVQVNPTGTTIRQASTTDTAALPPMTMPPQVKTALETAANASGTALGSGVPVRTSNTDSINPTSTDPTLQSPDSFNINDAMTSLGTPPAQPDLNAQQSSAESAVGIPAIQSNIQTLTTQYQNLQNDLQNQQANEASKPGVVASIINGRMTMVSAEQSKALNDLKTQIDSANTQLTQANSAVSTIMKNTETDYQNAVTAYNDQYSKALSLFSAQQNELSKEQTQASANAKVIIDSFKGSTSALTADQEAQFGTLELQAGLPQGFIAAAIQAESSQGVKVDHWQTDSATGTTYAFGTDANGKPILLQTFNTGGGTGGSGGTGNTTGSLPGTTGQPAIDSSTPGYTSQAVNGAGGLSQGAIDQAALQFALTGVMPSMGLGSTGLAGQRRVAIQNRAAELNSGGNIQANKAQLSALNTSLTQNTTYLNTVQRALSNAETGLSQLISQFSGKVNDQSLPIANVIANATKYNLGNGDVSAFKAGLAEVANEYTQVFSRGGQVSDSVRNRANDILNGNISLSNLQGVATELQTQGTIVLNGAQNQVQTIQNQINGIVGQGGSPANQLSSIQSDIQHAIKDTANVPNREALIPMIAQEYGISSDQASQYVYQYWTDNTQR